MELGKRITELRSAQGITVNKLANRAGISQSYLRDVELGNKQPTVEYLGYICNALGISLQDFFSADQQEDELTAAMRRLNPQQKELLAQFIKAL